jgi:HK97 family phage portal protein
LNINFQERNDNMGLFNKLFPQLEERAVYNMTNSTETVVDQPFSLDSLLVTDTVTEDRVLKIPTAKACVDVITSTIAQMPVYLYKENADGSIEKVVDKRINLLNHEANDFLNGYSLKKNMVKDYLLHGAAYVSIVAPANQILELHPLPAKSILVNKRIANGYRVVGAEIVLSNSESGAINANSKPAKFKPHELMIALGDTNDGLTSVGIIKRGQDVLKQALSEMDYTSNLYERGALPLGLLKTQARLNETQTSALRDAWRNLYGGIKNSAKTVVLQEGMEYQALSMNPNDIQMNETKRSTNSEICKLFNVPESMVNSTIGKQYVSIEQNNLAFLKNTLSPILASFESSMDRALLLESEKSQGYFFRFDTGELVRATEKEQVDTLVNAVSGGIFTINEARAKFNLPELDEEEIQPTTQEGADVNETEPEAEPGSQSVGTKND